MRLRRSELSTPGSSESMMHKAVASNADLVFLDLEDAVSPNEKVAARSKVITALKTLDWGKKTRAVRVNSLDTEYAYQDIIQIVEEAGEYLDIIIIPKVKEARDVWWVDVLLSQIEQRLKLRKRIGLEALIEEVEAMVNAEQIARSSPRLEALIFGPGDYSASQGVTTGTIGGDTDLYPGDIWHYARNKVIIAARAAGIVAVDGPYSAFRDLDGYRRECQRAFVLGAVGKWAIHPSQIAVAHEVFSPTQQAVERARKLVKAYEEARVQGLGAVAIDGDMIDAASVRILQKTLQMADLIGM
jgi:citrate lyase subunit beta/citryl-CoA lyase